MYDIVVVGTQLSALSFLLFMKETPLSIGVIHGNTSKESPFMILSEKTYAYIGAPKPVSVTYDWEVHDQNSSVLVMKL